jgi:hypothetical protein
VVVARWLAAGRFRQSLTVFDMQWAGEMITFSKEKTTLTDEFLELENDVELRRIGVTRSVITTTLPCHS